MIGRNDEMERLVAQYDLLNNESALCIITGSAGIGKSYFFEKYIQKIQASYIYCSCQQHEHSSFAVLDQIIEQSVKRILTLPLDIYKYVQHKLYKEIGNDLSLITSVCPFSKKLFGSYENKFISYNNMKYRLRKVLGHYFKIVADVLHPLVVCLDNLQWANETSMDMLHYFANNARDVNLQFVLISRRDEIKCFNKFEILNFLRIDLKNFTINEVEEYVSRIVSVNIVNQEYLVRLLYSLTLGNVYYLEKLVQLFLNNACIYEKDKTYYFDIDSFHSLDNIKVFMVNIINSFSRDDYDVLKLQSCLGTSVDKALIESLLDTDFDEFMKKHAILFNDNQLHNIVLELVYNHLKDREVLHYQIANYMVNGSGYSTLNITYHLLNSDIELVKKGDWLPVLYDAIDKVKNNESYKLQENLLKLIMILEPSKLLYEMNEMALIECMIFNSHFEEATIRLSKYQENISVKQQYMNLYVQEGKHQAALEKGREILKILDHQFSDSIMDLSDLLSSFSVSRPLNDEGLIRVIETLTKMIPSANIIDQVDFMKILLELGYISLHYGYHKDCIIGIAAYSYIMISVYDDYEKSLEFYKQCNQLLENADDHVKTVVYSFMGTFLTHHFESYEKSIEILATSLEIGELLGENYYQGYTLVSLTYVSLLLSRPISEILNHNRKSFDLVLDDTVYLITSLMNQYLQKLEDLAYDEEDFDHQSFESSDSRFLTFMLLKMMMACYEKDFDKAYSYYIEVEEMIPKLKGHLMYEEAIFFSAILLMHVKVDDPSIKIYMKDLKRSAHYVADNYLQKYNLLLAEYYFHIKKQLIHQEHYHQVIQKALESESYALAGFANLLLSSYHSGKLSKLYNKEAIECYEKWGANYLVEKFKDHQRSDKEISFNRTPDKIVTLIDEIDERTSWSRFFKVLSELYHLEDVTVLFEDNHRLYIEFENRNGEFIEYKTRTSIYDVDYLSRKIIRYVIRSGEMVIINEKPSDGIFLEDLYLLHKEKVSVVCMPISYMDIVIGVIYLEKECNNGFVDFDKSVIKGMLPMILFKRKSIHQLEIKENMNQMIVKVKLSLREIDVLELMAEGHSNDVIAARLHVSLGTIKSHLNRIYGKLEVNNRIRAVLKARELNIISF